MTRHTVCKLSDVAADKPTPVKAGRATMILLRLPSGEVKAVASRCPHNGAGLEHACITGLTIAARPNEVELKRKGEILRCPWHGFEFDISTGHAIVESATLRLRHYLVEIEGNEVVITT